MKYSSICMTCGSEVCDPAKHGKSLSDRLAPPGCQHGHEIHTCTACRNDAELARLKARVEHLESALRGIAKGGRGRCPLCMAREALLKS